MNVLMVDDCPITLASFEDMSLGEGVNITYANEYSSSPKGKFDLIILDLYMPNKSGIDICRQIKSNKKTKDIPVVVLSSSGSLEDKKECFNAGAIDYLVKPVTRTMLMNTINMYAGIGAMLKDTKRLQQGIKNASREKENRGDSLLDS